MDSTRFFEFLLFHWDSVLSVLIFIAAMVIMVRKGYTPKVKAILFYLVNEAEQQFGGGTGDLKFAAVSTWVHEHLPAIIQILFSKKQIDMMIEEAVLEMKKYLSKNEQARLLILGEEALK